MIYKTFTKTSKHLAESIAFALQRQKKIKYGLERGEVIWTMDLWQVFKQDYQKLLQCKSICLWHLQETDIKERIIFILYLNSYYKETQMLYVQLQNPTIQTKRGFQRLQYKKHTEIKFM